MASNALRRIERNASLDEVISAVNRALDVFLGNVGGRIQLLDDDGIDRNIVGGGTIGTSEPALKVRSKAGEHALFQHSNGVDTVEEIQDSGVTISDLTVIGDGDIGGELHVDGNTVLGDDISDTTLIAGPATLNATLNVKGNVTLGDAITDTVLIAGPATLNATLNVKGNVTLGDAGTDTVLVSGDLTVNGQASVKGNTVLGDAITDTVLAAGPVTMNATLSVKGNTTLGDAEGDTVTIVDWTVGVASDNLEIRDDAGALIVLVGDTSSTWHLDVTGPLRASGTINTGGNLELGSAVAPSGFIRGGKTVTFHALNEAGAAAIRLIAKETGTNNVLVGDGTNTDTIVLDSANGGSLRDSGVAVVAWVTGTTTVTGNLAVSGTLTAGAFSPSGTFTITGGDVRLDNTRGVAIKDTAANYRLVLQIDSGDRARFGYTGIAAHVDGTSISLNAATSVTGTLTSSNTLTVSAGGAAITGAVAITGGLTTTTTIAATTTITAGTGLTVTSGGATITAGGVTITAGGATVNGGNLTFGTTAQRITGDFSTATIANRPIFQSSAASGFTTVSAIPASGGVGSAWSAYNNATPTSGTRVEILINSTEARLSAVDAGGGTLPLVIQNGGSTRAIVEATGNITLCAIAGSYGSGTDVVFVGNRSVAPTTNPTGGGILYAAGGAGTWRGSSGTVTTFGPAEPHCPECGRDFAWQWENEKYGKLTICAWCFTEHSKRGIIERRAA